MLWHGWRPSTMNSERIPARVPDSIGGLRNPVLVGFTKQGRPTSPKSSSMSGTQLRPMESATSWTHTSGREPVSILRTLFGSRSPGTMNDMRS